VAGQVAGLLGLDGGGGEDAADGADVGDEVVALGLVELDSVCRLGERDERVGFSWSGGSVLI
jgi:hypothetical protein